jgi:AmmeMemoRadiSam system radical SAM enzyme
VRQAQILGNFVGGFEAHAVNISGELVRVFLHRRERGIPVGFIDFDSQIGADAMTVQKEHDFFDLTLLIPGLNDSDEEIDKMTKWVIKHVGPDIPHHFTAFHPAYKTIDRPSTSAVTLNRARRIAMDNGECYVYTGNVHDPAGQTTYCHGCGAILVERSGYRLGDWGLDAEGNCTSCGTPCAGVFEPTPGDWGGRRLPVRLAERK